MPEATLSRDDVEVITIDPGNSVYCDDCSKDFTNSQESGGLLFQSRAIGPCCAEKWTASAANHGEERFIRGRCPDEKSFADWVRQDLRGIRSGVEL